MLAESKGTYPQTNVIKAFATTEKKLQNLKILLDRLVGQGYIIVEARKGIFEKLIEKDEE